MASGLKWAVALCVSFLFILSAASKKTCSTSLDLILRDTHPGCIPDTRIWKKLGVIAVKCARHGFSSIPSFPKCTGKVDMSYNLLSTLNKNSFAKRNLDEVNHLILKNNEIREIAPDTFEDLKHLKDLDLSCNKLLNPSVRELIILPSLRVVDVTDNAGLDCDQILQTIDFINPNSVFICSKGDEVSTTTISSHATELTPKTVLTSESSVEQEDRKHPDQNKEYGVPTYSNNSAKLQSDFCYIAAFMIGGYILRYLF